MTYKTVRRALQGAVLAGAMIVSPIMAAGETLADALAAAYEHSGLLEQNRALLRAADEDVAVAVAALRPILSWSASVSRSFGSTESFNPIKRKYVRTGFVTNSADIAITASLLLYDFGAARLKIEAAKETVLGTREALVAIEQQVLLRALAAYVNVRRETETVSLSQNNVRLVRQELRAARDRFEVGEVTRTDVSLAEARLAASRANLALAEGNLMRAIEEFRAVVGRKPGNLQPVTQLPAIERNLDKAKSIALRNHPSMKEAQYEINAAELNMRRADAAMKPKISLSGRMAKSEDFDERDSSDTRSVSIDFGGPIYRGGELSALARQAIARAQATRSALHVVTGQVVQNVGNAMAGLRVATASIEATERQIRAARVAFRGVREEASLGQRTTLDVLTAEQDLLDAETSYTSAVADQTIAAYEVLASMGLMTAKHLGLNVQLYDPAEYYRLIKSAPIKSVQGEKLNRILRRIGD